MTLLKITASATLNPSLWNQSGYGAPNSEPTGEINFEDLHAYLVNALSKSHTPIDPLTATSDDTSDGLNVLIVRSGNFYNIHVIINSEPEKAENTLRNALSKFSQIMSLSVNPA